MRQAGLSLAEMQNAEAADAARQAKENFKNEGAFRRDGYRAAMAVGSW